jgi:hypothetical protein
LGKRCCKICGCTEERWLTIDHINGGGTKHCKKLGQNRLKLYQLIITDPDRKSKYRILCQQDNFLLPLYGNDERKLKAAHRRNNKRIWGLPH